MKSELVRLSLPLRHSTTAPGVARRAVRKALAEAPDDLVTDALLLTSELVSNAVTHTADGCSVDLHFDLLASFVRVDVHDSSLQPPTLVERSAGAGGLGLRIVDRMSTAWGWQPDPQGKTVWFELRPP